DYRLPDADGLECLREIRQRWPDVPVVVITGAGSEEVAVEAMKLGASDYLVKHGKYLVTVPVVVREALGRRELERTAARYRSALRSSRRERGAPSWPRTTPRCPRGYSRASSSDTCAVPSPAPSGPGAAFSRRPTGGRSSSTR